MSRDDQNLKKTAQLNYILIKMKNKELLLSQQFQSLIEKSKKEAKSITLTHIYMGVHLTWLGAYTSITSFGVSQDSPLDEII